MVTIKDVAKLADVSMSTVSRVVNNSHKVSEDTRERVLNAIEELNYQPNYIARSMKVKKTYLIGVIVADISNTFFTKLVKGIEDETEAYNYNIAIASSDENPEKENRIINAFLSRQVDGLIITTCQSNPDEIEKHLDKAPIVLLDRRIEGFTTDIVCEENIGTSKDVIKYLYSMGHRKIAIANGPESIITSKDRYQGYVEAHKELNLKLDPDLVINYDYSLEDYMVEDVKKQLLAIPKENRPTAIFASNNSRAEIILEAAFDLGINIPEDLSLVSYGDINSSNLLPFKLTHIHQDIKKLGNRAGEILIRKMDNPENDVIIEHIIQSSLVKGDTVKRI